ncbi:MAG: hypothetical protein KBC34_01080 [Phenylobacterium sp.]|nr:hypothetical protein [Phenylobacterium sp.]
MTSRSTHTDVRGGCYVCHDTAAGWTGKNAMAVAARHAKASGHPTWCVQTLRVTFGDPPTPDGQQADLFPPPTVEDTHAA